VSDDIETIKAELFETQRLLDISQECIRELRLRERETAAALKDPAKVYVNMLRGHIYIPTVREYAGLYGEVYNDLDAANLTIAELREAALAKREAVAEDADPSGYTPQGNPAESASKIVPPAITDFMIDAGVSELQRYCFSEGVHTIHDDDACRNIFTAMLAASQQAAKGEGA